jgi:hypothetical protein
MNRSLSEVRVEFERSQSEKPERERALPFAPVAEASLPTEMRRSRDEVRAERDELAGDSVIDSTSGRRDGRVVECTALERRRTRKGTQGSNPCLSAIESLFTPDFTPPETPP